MSELDKKYRFTILKDKETTTYGVIATYDGKYWTEISDSDGPGSWTSEFWGDDIEKAKISDPKYCKKPTDLTYEGSRYVEKLSKATLIPVRIQRRIIYEKIEDINVI